MMNDGFLHRHEISLLRCSHAMMAYKKTRPLTALSDATPLPWVRAVFMMMISARGAHERDEAKELLRHTWMSYAGISRNTIRLISREKAHRSRQPFTSRRCRVSRLYCFRILMIFRLKMKKKWWSVLCLSTNERNFDIKWWYALSWRWVLRNYFGFPPPPFRPTLRHALSWSAIRLHFPSPDAYWRFLRYFCSYLL